MFGAFEDHVSYSVIRRRVVGLYVKVGKRLLAVTNVVEIDEWLMEISHVATLEHD